MERVLSTDEQSKILRADLENVLYYQKWINSKTQKKLDSKRILGVVAAGKGSENYLPYTVPKIVKQISEMGLGADIVVGLNNGFECQAVTNYFALIPDTKIIHLYTGEKTSSTAPAELFENAECAGPTYRISNHDLPSCKHRIFVVHQRKGIYAAGKIRVLGDIYGSLLLRSIDDGWIPPAFQVAFDAESQFLVNENHVVPKIDSNGLIPILNELRDHPDIDLLGANNRYVVYRQSVINGMEVLVPDFDEELPPIQWYLNILHGQYPGFKYKPAGGTVGKTDVLISLFTVITQKYPGARIDDVHLTVLAKGSGFKGEIFMNTASTNRVPSISDKTVNAHLKLAWMEQVYRWSAGIYALELNYGKENVRPICSASFPWNVILNPMRFWKRLIKIEQHNFYNMLRKLGALTRSLPAYIEINKRALENPDVLQGPEAKASW
jgi:hypothetical protein